MIGFVRYFFTDLLPTCNILLLKAMILLLHFQIPLHQDPCLPKGFSSIPLILQVAVPTYYSGMFVLDCPGFQRFFWTVQQEILSDYLYFTISTTAIPKSIPQACRSNSFSKFYLALVQLTGTPFLFCVWCLYFI